MKPLLQLLCVYLIGAASASATTLTFDDLPNQILLTNYGGLHWSGFEALKGSSVGHGAANGVVSPFNVIQDISGQPAQFTSATPFDLDSAYLTGSLRDGLSVEVQGFIGTTLVYDNTYVVNTTGPELVNFDYLGIDEAKFIPSGGTLHPGYTGDNFASFVMDNVTINAPDGGATVVMLGMTITALAVVKQRFARR